MPDFLEKIEVNNTLLNNTYFVNIISGIASGIVSGIVSGIIVGIILLYIQRKINEKDKETEALKKSTITNDLINELSPEKNYKKAKEKLGEPNKTYEDYSISENNSDIIYQSDLYVMNNGVLKITTRDKISISALTLFWYDDSNIEIPFYEFFNEGTRKVITEDFVNSHSNYLEIRTIRDYAFAIQVGLGAPFYKHLTLFTCRDSNNVQDYIDKNIEGFCLSDTEDAFYIYDSECR